MPTMNRPEPGPITWLAHQYPRIMVGSLAYSALKWFEIRLPWYIALIFTVIFLTTMFSGFIHLGTTQLCVRCIQDVPLDPQKKIEKQAWTLWGMHRIMDGVGDSMRRGLALMAFILLFPQVVDSIFYWHFNPFGTTHGWTNIPTDLLFVFLLYGLWVHHRLQRWCPYCRWGRGDDGQPEVVPDPVPSATKDKV